MLKAAIEQFGDKSEDEIAFGKAYYQSEYFVPNFIAKFSLFVCFPKKWSKIWANNHRLVN